MKLNVLKNYSMEKETKIIGREVAFWALVFPVCVILIALVVCFANPIDNHPYTGVFIICIAIFLAAGVKLFRSLL